MAQDGSIARGAISFTDPDVQRCPFAAYAEVRKSGPVYHDPKTGFFIVTDYEQIQKVAADPALFSSVTGLLLVKEGPGQENIGAIYAEEGFPPVSTLVVTDPPVHTFHRALLDKIFTAARVREMETYLESVIDGMIDEFIDRGEVEFYQEMAMKVPLYVIADQLGVPRDNFKDFKRWVDAIVQEADPNNDEATQIEVTRTICEFQRYLAQKAEEFQRTPGKGILSDIVHAEVDGRRLGMPELVSLFAQLLAAGSETTGNAITLAVHAMISRPGMEETLRADPALIPNFVEEVLRLEAPVQGLFRRATRDTAIAGVAIPEGSIVIVRYGAGNRDPSQFPDPDAMDLHRPNARRHIAFGSGPHFCIGNLLARSELRIALTRLLARLRHIRLARGQEGVSWRSHFFVYGPDRLEIAFDRI